MGQADAEQWKELAVETVRNLSRVVEEGQAALRRAESRLRQLGFED